MAPEFKQFEGQETRDFNAFSPALEYDGLPLRDQPWRHERTKHTADYFFAEDLGELNALLDGIVQEGSIPSEVRKLRPEDYSLGPGVSIPDFHVRLIDGAEFFAEVTSAGQQSTIRQEETLNEMSHALASWSLATSEVQSKLNGRELSFMPLHLFKGKDEKTAVAEMKAFALSENLQPYQNAPGTAVNAPSYPVLTRAETAVYVTGSVAPTIQVLTPGGSWSPEGEVDAILDRIEAKIKNGYYSFRPIRLIVSSTYAIGHRGDTFSAIEKRLDSLGPFERIYVADSNATLVAYRGPNAIPEIDDRRDVRQEVIPEWRIERHNGGPLMLLHDPGETHELKSFRLDPSRDDFGLDFDGEAMTALMTTLARRSGHTGSISSLQLRDEAVRLLNEALERIRRNE